MDHNEFFQKLLATYRDSYNIEENFRVGNNIYDADAFLDVSTSRYVLVKKAEIWRTDCYEHVFITHREQIVPDDIYLWEDQVASDIEPRLVRGGEATMPKDHMSSFVTGVFITNGPVDVDTANAVRDVRFYKNYKMSLRGYCQARAVLIDLKYRRVYGNRAAHDMVKDLRKSMRSLK